MIPVNKLIVFVCCHAGPADHFATFSEQLSNDGYRIEVHASGPALKRLQDRDTQNLTGFPLDSLSPIDEDLLTDQLVNKCSQASAVICDVGHKFMIGFQKKLEEKSPKVLRIAYYDNPESPDPYLPKDYSTIAKQVMMGAQRVLFANAHLAKDPSISLPKQERIELGFYPTLQAEILVKKRALDHPLKRALFIKELGIEDLGEQVITYFGGNNLEYFKEAFPAFLGFLTEAIESCDLSSFIIVLQQHPGAKNANLDAELVKDWVRKQAGKTYAPKFIISTKTTDEMQVISEGALYHQTSMGPLLSLSGIPLIQVGCKPYQDVLIKSGLCPSITDSPGLIKALLNLKKNNSMNRKEEVLEGLGLKEDWKEILKRSLKS